MSLYAIADLHLSLGTDKPMDIFPGWGNYTQKIEKNWRSTIHSNDTVVIAGDISWAMDLNEALPDFAFLHSLPGKKILLKGNHDYYFSTKGKVENFFLEHDLFSLNFLFNNSYEYEDYSICGTRGWINEPGEPANQKVLAREAGRMELSLKSALHTPIVFLHYPPVYAENQSEQMLNVLRKYCVKHVFYGHLHGKACQFALQGEYAGIEYHLISGDALRFKPIKVLE